MISIQAISLGRLLTGAAVVMVLAGCSSDPVYRTSYQLTEPATLAGRQCTTQCETNRMLCQQNASAEQAQCRQRAQDDAKDCKRRARSDYNNCMSQSRYGGSYRASMERSCRSILQSSTMQCDSRYDRCELDTTQCDTGYRSCFATCGGKVDKQVRCVANCDKKP